MEKHNELVELAKSVIPKTWNVFKYCNMANLRNEKGVLNIELDILNEPLKKKIKSLESLGHIRFIAYFNGVGYTKINIHCYPIRQTGVVLHELAHIAVFRLESLITKSYKDNSLCNGSEIEPDPHGKIFNNFLNIFEKRAIKKGWKFVEIKSEKIWQKDRIDF